LELEIDEDKLNSKVSLDKYGLPSSFDIVKVINRLFLEDNEYFISRIEMTCKREYNITNEAMHFQTKDIKGSRTKTAFKERIRHIIYHKYELFGLITSENYIYTKTPLFDLYIKEEGSDITLKKLRNFENKHKKEIYRYLPIKSSKYKKYWQNNAN